MVASKNRQHHRGVWHQQLGRRIGRGFRSLWIDDRGQSTTEYILILAVVVMIAMKFKGLMTSNMTSMLNTLNQNLNQAVQDTSNQQ